MEPLKLTAWSKTAGAVPFEIVKAPSGVYMYKIHGITENYPEADKQGWITSSETPEVIESTIRQHIETKL